MLERKDREGAVQYMCSMFMGELQLTDGICQFLNRNQKFCIMTYWQKDTLESVLQ